VSAVTSALDRLSESWNRERSVPVFISQCSTSEFAGTKARPEDAVELGDGVQTTLEVGV
jgi:hypothetical protein